MLDVDPHGFDVMDRKLLEAVIHRFDGGPVGLDNVAAAIGEERDTIEDVIEPLPDPAGLTCSARRAAGSRRWRRTATWRRAAEGTRRAVRRRRLSRGRRRAGAPRSDQVFVGQPVVAHRAQGTEALGDLDDPLHRGIVGRIDDQPAGALLGERQSSGASG